MFGDEESGAVDEAHELSVQSTRADSAEAVADVLRQRCVAQPQAVALSQGDLSITYGHLHNLVAVACAILEDRGLRERDLLVLEATREPDTVAWILACLSSGVCYVPVDPAAPTHVLEDLADRVGARGLVTRRPLDRLDGLRIAPSLESPTWPAARWPDWHGDMTDPAYVIFTSGSTGVPKGATITQANLRDYLRFAAPVYRLRRTDRALQAASLAFDWSISEVLPTLAAGATLVLRSDRSLESAAELIAEVRQHGLSFLHLPTAVWHAMLPDLVTSDCSLPASVRHVTIGAEQVDAGSVRQWREHYGDSIRLVNAYGPTECTVEATHAELAGPDALDVADRTVIPIGRPLPGCRVYVLDEQLREMPAGETGTIYIAGWGVGAGYFGDTEQTARRFLPDPFSEPGSMMYDTGDRGRWTGHGDLEFAGRLDNQVKISGYRIELEDVEAQILAHPKVAEAAVVHDVIRGSLEAFIVGVVDPQQVRAWLAQRVAPPLVPARLSAMTRLPRTSNDKIDRRALLALSGPLAPAVVSAPDSAEDSASVTVEHTMLTVLRAILGDTSVSATDDFFTVGGHSILAMRFTGQLRRHGIHIQVRDIFELRTIRTLAERAQTS